MYDTTDYPLLGVGDKVSILEYFIFSSRFVQAIVIYSRDYLGDKLLCTAVLPSRLQTFTTRTK